LPILFFGRLQVEVPKVSLLCGRSLWASDPCSAVSADYGGSESPFMGTIGRVVVDVRSDQHPTPRLKDVD
jgi:hypothetical protein